MAVLPHANGTPVRVWAPHFQQVFVKDDFNDWDDTAHPPEQQSNGYWYADVTGAHPGQGYKHRHINQGTVLERIDPYAREVTHSLDRGVIHDSAFDDDDDVVLQPHNELVINELHIGSFNPDSDDQPGDFSETADELGNLKHLGVNAMQVMPVAECAGDYSCGYNPASLFAIENAYGGPAAFKAFIRETRGLCGQFINLFHVNDRDSVLAFQPWDRRGPRYDEVVVLNFGHQDWEHYEIGMPVTDHWRLRFNSDASSYSADFGNHPSADVMAQPDPMDGLDALASVSHGSHCALNYCLPARAPRLPAGRIVGAMGIEDIHPSRTGLAAFFIDEALKETKEV